MSNPKAAQKRRRIGRGKASKRFGASATVDAEGQIRKWQKLEKAREAANEDPRKAEKVAKKAKERLEARRKRNPTPSVARITKREMQSDIIEEEVTEPSPAPVKQKKVVPGRRVKDAARDVLKQVLAEQLAAAKD